MVPKLSHLGRSSARAAVAASSRGGFAALTVVMVLFFIMALVAAYFNRNAIVEQRIGSNAYRGMRAAEAAESGIDWTVALLNAGRVARDCTPSAAAADEEMRQRVFNIDDAGMYSPTAVSYSGCVLGGAGATQRGCVCPTRTSPGSDGEAGWPQGGATIGFRVLINPVGSSPNYTIGLLNITSTGCGYGGSLDRACTAAPPGAEVLADASIQHHAIVGLLRHLPYVPPAALTVGGTVSSGANRLTVVNADPQQAVTVHSGHFAGAGVLDFRGPAGSPGDSAIWNDSKLAALVPVRAADRWTAQDTFFRKVFQLEPGAFRTQPAVIRTDCAAATGCDGASLATLLNSFPQRAVWFDGDLTLGTEAPVAIGSDTDPVLFVVKGRLTLNAPLSIKGLVYAESIVWGASAVGGSVDGALIAVDDFAASSQASIVYGSAALRRISARYGSWVRMPNGWTNQNQ